MTKDHIRIHKEQLGEPPWHMLLENGAQRFLVEEHAVAMDIDRIFDFGYMLVEHQFNRVIGYACELQFFDGVEVVHQHLL